MKICNTSICLVFFVAACVATESKIHEVQSPRHVIILIQSADSAKVKDAALSYIDDLGFQQTMRIEGKEADTINIPTDRKNIEVRYSTSLYHKPFTLQNYGSFLLHRGDTVVLDLNKPPASAIRKKTSGDLDLSFDELKNSRICNDSFPTVFIQKNFMAFIQWPKDVNNFDYSVANESLFRQLKEKDKTETQRSFSLLDSLKMNGAVSNTFYNYQTAKLTFESRRVQLDHPSIYLVKQKVQHQLLDSLENEMLAGYADTLLNYYFFNDVVNWLYIVEGRKMPRRITTGVNAPDYRLLYDSLKANRKYSAKLKKALLAKCFEDVIKIYPNSVVNSVKNDFQTAVGDSSLSSYIFKKYKLDQSLSNQLRLKSLSEDTVDFESFIKANKGKVIYVDFWASWCSPCIAAFPASQKMKEKFAGKNIVFVYISKDEERERWLRAITKHPFLKNNESFIVDNAFTSRLIEDLAVNTIPRYLIFDKNGKLIHKNAPGPDSQELNKLIEQLL